MVFPKDDLMLSTICTLKMLVEIIYYMEVNSQFKTLCRSRTWLQKSLLIVRKHARNRSIGLLQEDSGIILK
jgi:hypothetical protein